MGRRKMNFKTFQKLIDEFVTKQFGVRAIKCRVDK